MKQLVRDWIPPAIVRLIHSTRGARDDIPENCVGWHGDYPTWEEAKADSSGYDSENILEKVKTSTLKVKHREAVFERDSVLFDHIEYSWPVLAGLMWAAARHQGKLNVLDFGGSLGSSYFQNRIFFPDLPKLQWSVVEQAHFVTYGREYIQDDCLRFYPTIDECLSERSPNVVLLSGVVQYLPDWLSTLQGILLNRIPVVLVDRTPFVLNGKGRITVQTVPEWIYPASYPCRFFNESIFIQTFVQSGYRMIEEFDALDRANIQSIFKGFIFSYKLQ